MHNFLYQGILHNRYQTHGKEMVCVTERKFIYGDNKQEISLPGFWIGRILVTNREFARFVKATGYKTTAEKTGLGCSYTGSKWKDMPGADWRHPSVPNSDIQCRWERSVVQVSWADTVAYTHYSATRRHPLRVRRYGRECLGVDCKRA